MSGKRNTYGAKGVFKCGDKFRVQFWDRSGTGGPRLRRFGRYATVEEARAVSDQVQAYRALHGELPHVLHGAYLAPARRDNRSGVKGVQRYGDRYRVRARVGGELRHLGVFDTLEEAREAAERAQAATLAELRERLFVPELPGGSRKRPAQRRTSARDGQAANGGDGQPRARPARS